jgi:Helix-turn-helix domain
MKKESVPLALATVGSDNFPTRPLSIAELAAWLDVSRRFLEGQIEKGQLRVRRISPRCIRVLPGDVARWLEQTATTEVDA